MNSKIPRLPDEIYLKIFSLSKILPLKLRISKYVEHLVLRYLPIPDNEKFRIYKILILFNRLDLIKLYSYNVSPNVEGSQRGKYVKLYLGHIGHEEQKKINPLMLASRFCRCGIVRYFLSLPNIKIGSWYLYLKAFTIAIKRGYISIVLMFLNNDGVSITEIFKLQDLETEEHYSIFGISYPDRLMSWQLFCDLLHDAINKKHTKIIEILLESKKIEYREYGSWYCDLPCHAIKQNNVDALRSLLKYGHHKLNEHEYIYEASKCKSLDILMFLINDLHMDPSVKDNLAIITASEYGNIEVVRLLLSDKRVDPSAQNNQAIINASKWGELEVVRLLLSDKRVDPSAQHNGAIHQAHLSGHLDIYNLLKEYGCESPFSLVD